MTIADVLKVTGVAGCHASDLMPPEVWLQLQEFAQAFEDSPKVQEAKEKHARGESQEGRKAFLVKLREESQQWFEDILCHVGRAMIPIVREAYGPEMNFFAADMWHVFPSPGKEREWSQNWHRDPESDTVVKAMLFFWDVDDEAGPTQYVIGSHAGKYADLANDRSYANYGAADKIKDEDVATLTVRAGSIVFLVTSGLHRGGYARSKPRLSATWTFIKGALMC